MSWLMCRYTLWLQDTIWLQLQGGRLFRDGERVVHSCRATSSAANAAENAGDEFLTRGRGRGMLMNQLLMLPGMSRIRADSQADVCCQLARYFCANVGFGPYAAEALDLRQLYTFTPGLRLTREVLAGLFEQTLHVLQRAGLDALVKNILMWCVGCVLYRLSAGRDNFLEHLNGQAYALAVDLGASDLMWPRGDHRYCPMVEAVFAIDEGYNADADVIFGFWVEMAMRESNAGAGAALCQDLVPVGADSVESRHGGQMRGGDMRSFNQGDRTYYYMDLKCYEWGCTNRDQTAAHGSQEGARAEALSKGWYKPTTKGWSHVRCPTCCRAADR